MSRFGNDARVWEAIAFMRAHLAEPLTVADIARYVEFSASRFSHVFREETAMTPCEALRDIRLEKGAELLETTDWPVKRIAREVGMGGDGLDPCHSDGDDPAPSTFGRLFKEWSGDTTPGAWRRMKRLERAVRAGGADGGRWGVATEPKFKNC